MKGCPMRLTVPFPHLRGLRLVHRCATAEHLTLVVTPTRRTARCPCCRCVAHHVHSRFRRRITDLPCGGRAVIVMLQARRFFCRTATCPKRTFRERFPALVAPRVRRSHGLRSALTRIGMALGGDPGARLARHLSMPTSGDTVLRLLRAAPLPAYDSPRVLGIDDWSWRRGRTFGTMLVDLEAHRPVDLLADRAPDEVAAWLDGHRGTEIVARDRGEGYADGVRRGAPSAIQVADRWHLLDNLGAAIERFLLNKQPALKATAVALAVANASERVSTPSPRQPWRQRQEEEGERRHAKKIANYEAIHTLRRQGADIADVARTVGVSRQTVYRYLRLESPPVRPRPRRHPRPRVLDPYDAYIRERWEQGCHNGMRLWREIKAQGFGHSYTPVSRLTAQLRKGQATTSRPRTGLTDIAGPTARQVSLLFLRHPSDLTDTQRTYLTAVCRADALIATAYAVTQEFGGILRERQGEWLDAWIETACTCAVAALHGFATGLRADYAAVKAGLTLEWSNGQTEGQINRLKMLKRQMYGRAGFDLLRQRVLYRG
jgi:transposase